MEITPAIKTAIEEGSIKVETGTVKAKHPKKGEPDLTREYQKFTAVNAKGMLALCDGKQEGVVDNFNYAFDLGVRSRVRQQLLASVEGPDKKIEQMAKLAVAAGLAPNQEAAEKMIRAQFMAAAAETAKAETEAEAEGSASEGTTEATA